MLGGEHRVRPVHDAGVDDRPDDRPADKRVRAHHSRRQHEHASDAEPQHAASAVERPGDLLPPTLERIRRARGPFDSDDDLLLAVFYNDEQYRALRAAGPIERAYAVERNPLLTLLQELGTRRDIASVRLVKS